MTRRRPLERDAGEVPSLPLAGIRVLDIATLFAAPWAASYLGEFGADVIKVEQPRVGDHQRRWGTRKDGRALFWKSIARNKRCVTLDLRTPKGAALFRRLAAQADVVIENFRPGTLERWGLDYATLSAENPGLVMLRVSGYGQTGPYRERPGFGTLAEAMSGFSHLTGEQDGPPTLANLPVGDGFAAITGAFAVMVALYHRDVNGGRGQVIDLSLVEPLLRLSEPALLDYDQLGVALERMGNRSAHVAPRNTYRCGDGRWVALSASAQSIFERLVRAIGRPEMIEDPRFSTNAARVENVVELDGIIGGWMGARPRAEVLAAMEAAEVAVGPVYDVPSIFADPHLQARETLIPVQDPDFGEMRLISPLPRFSETPGVLRFTGPHLGAHNAEVFGELGLSAEEIEQLRDEEVL